jgi:hypothetical protein
VGRPSCDSTPNLKQREIELSFYSSGSFGGALKGVRDLCPTDAGDFASLPTTSKVQDFAQKFRHVTLEISRTPCTGSTGVGVRLSIEGIAEGSCASLGAGDPFTHGAALTMQLGLFASGKWAESAIAYDDVTVDFD